VKRLKVKEKRMKELEKDLEFARLEPEYWRLRYVAEKEKPKSHIDKRV